MGPVGLFMRTVVGSGRVQQFGGAVEALCGVQWIEGRSRPFPSRCAAGLILREGCPKEYGDGCLGAFRQVFAFQTCTARWSCHCGSTTAELFFEMVGTDLSGAGALLLLLSALRSAW